MHHNLIINDGDTTKVEKQILVDGIQFVDKYPIEGSDNPVTSGGVAGSVAQQSSNLAPDYTKTTYKANSYVMYGGVLYTNPNAIGTAEDWNPAHWTQTTVAEMMANAGGYKQVNLTFAQGDTKTIPVGQKEDVYVECQASSSDDVIIQLAEDCTDAVLTLKRLNSVRFRSVSIKRGNSTVQAYGLTILTGITKTELEGYDQVLLTSKYVDDDVHGGGIWASPEDFNEIDLNESTILADVQAKNINTELIEDVYDSWLFVVKGRTVAILPN